MPKYCVETPDVDSEVDGVCEDGDVEVVEF